MRIYFSGIGGVGIGPLAEISLDAGYDVLGSDLNNGLMAHALRQRNVTISLDQSGQFLRAEHDKAPIDWFVYTAALPVDHPELVAARELGIRTAKRDELLAHIIADKGLKLIAVAGTHGKTTTTGMMAWTLKQLGVPVSYSIGTTLSWGPSGHFNLESEYFVYECDEFDRNFLHFHPHLSLVTSIEWDHPDTYPTEADYFEAFSQFAQQSGQTIMWASDTKDISVPENSWLLQDSEVQSIALAGAHNRRNATLVAKGVEYLVSKTDEQLERPLAEEIAAVSVPAILATFPGTNRRFEKLTDNLYSDYGHTPTEIAATLQMAREISDRVILIYQPHQNIRQHEIIDQYTDEVFTDADEVFWLPTYLSREDPKLDILSPGELTKNLDDTKVHIADLDESLWDHMVAARKSGALILAMGGGSIDGWVRQQNSKG